MLASFMPAAETIAAQALHPEDVEEFFRVGHETRWFSDRISPIILLPKLALIGDHPVHTFELEDRLDARLLP